MSASFTLELYYERDRDYAFTVAAGKDLQTLVTALAPHVTLKVEVLKAHRLVRSTFTSGGSEHDVPNHLPSRVDRQSLLFTTEDIGAQGWAGPGKGCVSKERMERKILAGGNGADITIHEWLHTIEGVKINGWKVPNADSSATYGFQNPSGIGGDGEPTWHAWFTYALGGQPRPTPTGGAPGITA